MASLDGKIAFVSGGAGGLGAAFVRAFVAEGACVVFGDIADAAGCALAEELGAQAVYVRLDVTDEAQWQAAIALVRARFGRLDILVNNAGIVVPPAPIEQRSVQEWDATFAVNAKGVFLGTKFSLPALRAAGGGAIINISSLAGLGQARLQEPAYAASKAAVRTLTKVTAAQYAAENIRCNSVHPGPIDAGMLQRYLAHPEASRRRLARIPLGRRGTIDEVVAGVVYLASDGAGFTTGAELVIDGGALVD